MTVFVPKFPHLYLDFSFFFVLELSFTLIISIDLNRWHCAANRCLKRLYRCWAILIMLDFVSGLILSTVICGSYCNVNNLLIDVYTSFFTMHTFSSITVVSKQCISPLKAITRYHAKSIPISGVKWIIIRIF